MAVGKYDTHVKPKLLLIEAWARDGLTDEDIAKNLDVGVSTFHAYKKDHPELVESLKGSKDEADIKVENALYKRALGFEYDEVTQEPLFNPVTGDPILGDDGEQKIAVTKIVRKMVNPDTTAQIFWLKNRRPAAWRDKQDIEHSGHMTNKIDLSGLSVEDLRAYAKTKSSTT
ncbi:transposase [Paenibacillus alkaliterrae]|uniref:transposase n=1 Tax=Paenibacillus alkaliterrae TaxID=320909 RepID=UPI001F2537A3|nr:transposase [Paenibacillus alkaliterrae]MCF2938913.1 transposase [Paenibacillus alkaliterrae]